MAAKFFLLSAALIIIFSLHATCSAAAYSQRRGFRSVMTRTEPEINYTRVARSSHRRLSLLAARLDAGRVSAETPLQLDSDGGGYDMTLSIGTPPQKLSAAADTGSDLVWVKCGACEQCAPQGSPSYYPNKSSSFSKLPCSDRLCSDLGSNCSTVDAGAGAGECDYEYFYGVSDNGDPQHYTKGYLGSETFTLGSDAVRGIGFGCTDMSAGNYGTGSGLVGLSRGALSLVSQLGAGAFSYCLDRDSTKQSPLLFGTAAVFSSGSGAVQTTPLLPSGPYYSVDLRRISIGAVQTRGPGTKDYGTLIDSGTTLTFLSEPAYTEARRAMLNQTKLPRAADRDGYDMCFHTTTARGGGGGLGAVPEMVLHFDGADMALPWENYFAKVGKDVICWIVQKSPYLSVVGNIMQMNYHIRYDVDKGEVAFQQANCDTL